MRLLQGAALAGLIAAAAAGCGESAGRRAFVADSIRQDSVRTDSIRRARADSIHRADSVRVADSVRHAEAGRRHRRRAEAPAPPRRTAYDSVPWPAPPPVLGGALLPGHRIVAFYGNPLSRRMGILGELPPAQMLAKLDTIAGTWRAADSTRPVRPALHMIVTVAQGKPGRDGKHRLRMGDSLIAKVAGWAESRGWLFLMDIQVGQSTVEAELPRLIPFLTRPYVHLALDPEFDMPDAEIPGKRIGTMDARDVNYAIGVLDSLVRADHLPPKILVVHRFTDRMLTQASHIRRTPDVQVVVDMDGFGTPRLKRSTWQRVIQRDPVQYTGFKLFFKNDKPMMTPAEVIRLFPSPVYIQYQ